MNGPLVDAEGFPRDDIDLYQVRSARHDIICERGPGREGAFPRAGANRRRQPSTPAALPVTSGPRRSARSFAFLANRQAALRPGWF